MILLFERGIIHEHAKSFFSFSFIFSSTSECSLFKLLSTSLKLPIVEMNVRLVWSLSTLPRPRREKRHHPFAYPDSLDAVSFECVSAARLLPFRVLRPRSIPSFSSFSSRRTCWQLSLMPNRESILSAQALFCVPPNFTSVSDDMCINSRFKRTGVNGNDRELCQQTLHCCCSIFFCSSAKHSSRFAT